MLRSLVPVSVVVLLAGCSENGDPCLRVRCSTGYVCEPTTGLCLRGDGGTTPTKDAGVDAGEPSDACDPVCTSGLVCDPVSKTCVQCVSNSDCSCPTPVCNGATQTCISQPTDAGRPPAPGESCGDAVTLVFPGCDSKVTTTVDLGAFGDEEYSRCGGENAQGLDAVYLVKLATTRDLRVTAAPLASGVEPVISLRRDPCETGAELACVDRLGGSPSFLAKSLPAGTYALVLDSYGPASAGPISLTVEQLPPTQPSNESCETAAALNGDGEPVWVDLAKATDDETLTCNPRPQSVELVYALQVEEASSLVAIARSDAGVDTVLGLRSGPCDATGVDAGLVCADSRPPFDDVLRRRQLEPGTYFLTVEARTAIAGTAPPVELRATLGLPVAAPQNDTCAQPRGLAIPSGSTSLTVNVDTGFADDDLLLGCNADAGTSAELVYRLDWPEAAVATITARPAAGSSAAPVIELKSGACGDAGVSEACTNTPPTSTISRTLPAGSYYLLVEGRGPTGQGAIELTITRSP